MIRAIANLFHKTNSPASLEEKLALLAACGFHLDEPFTIDELLSSWDRAEYEKPGFHTALVGLGMTEERPPWRDHCKTLWHFDTECIENDGDYVRIAERMKTLAHGSLPIENMRDHVDVEGEVAWLEFDFEDEHIHLDCKVNDDWVDTGIFKHFARLLAQSDPTRIFLYHDLDGQDCIVACTTKTQFKELKRAGIRFQPLG